MKEKDTPENNKRRIFSQKLLVVLIIFGVGLAVLATGIVMKFPPKNSPAELSNNKVATKIVVMPTPEPSSFIPSASDSKENAFLPQAEQTAQPSKSNSMLVLNDNQSADSENTQMQGPEIESLKSDDSQPQELTDDAPQPQELTDDNPQPQETAEDEPQPQETAEDEPQPWKTTGDDSQSQETVANSSQPQAQKVENADTRSQVLQKAATQGQIVQSLSQSSVDTKARPFTVQVGVFRVDVYANRKAAQLKRLEYPSFIHEVIGRDDQPIYLVCFGRFETRKEAYQAVEAFKEKEKMEAVVAFLKRY